MRVDVTGFDLTKDVRGKLKVFDFPSMPVQIHVEVQVPDKKLEPLMTQKMRDAARKRLDDILDLFTSEMKKIDARVSAALAKDPSSVDLKDEQHTADVVSKQIADTLEAQVQDACEETHAELGRAHKELLKYRLKCAAKIAWASVKLTVAAVRLGASQGADVSAWISAGQDIYKIATVVYELAKSADTVQKEVGKEYENLVLAVAKVRKETSNIKVALRQVADVEPKCKKVDEKLGVLRPKVTGIDEKSHDLARGLEKLLNAAEAAGKNINVKAKAKLPEMEKKIDGMIVKIENMQVKVQEMRKYVEAITMTVAQFRTDYSKGAATTVKVVDFLSKCKEMYDQAKEVIDTIKEVVDLAA
jgi:hypothetical protein